MRRTARTGAGALHRALRPYYSVGLAFAAWEASSRSPWVNRYVFPAVSDILLRWVRFIGSGEAWGEIALTVTRAFGGLLAACVVGIVLGLWMGRSRGAAWFFEPLFVFGFPVPKIALIPLYVHWFGLFTLSKMALVFTDCLFPMVVFTYHGAVSVQAHYLWSAMSKGTRGVGLVRKVVFPLALPHIFDGFQLALVVALLVAFVSEMVAGGGGLGFVMIRAYRYADATTAFASLLTISLIGYLVTKGAQRLRQRVLAWYVEER